MHIDNLVTIKNLHFSHLQKNVFSGVDINIARGKITAILGPSGTGKTTLLKLIGAQLYPQQGTVLFDGVNVHKLTRTELYRARQKMGMLFQSGALFTNISVFDNVAFPLREHTNLSEGMIRTLVLLRLELVGLCGAMDLMPGELSGGMARRVALARAIIMDPDMIMYDEPLTGQDPITLGVLVKLIRELNDNLNLTSVVVSHDVPEVLSIADYCYVLADGKIVGYGTPQEIKNTKSEKVRQFIEGLPDGPVPFHYPAKNSFVDELLKGSANV